MTYRDPEIEIELLSRLALKIVVMARQEALMQEAKVKRVWAILLVFTQIGFIVFTYLRLKSELNISGKNNSQSNSQCLDDVITKLNHLVGMENVKNDINTFRCC